MKGHPGVPTDSSVLRMLEKSQTLFLPPERITDRPFWAGHVPFALWLMEQHRPQLTVELGTETGVSLAAFSQAAAALDLVCDIHGIDSWEGDSHTGHYAGVFEDLRAYFSEKGYGFTHLHRMLFDEALALFEDNSIDLLHIDGCHTYEAVRHDFESWKRKLSSRAVVLFHDTQVKKGDFGVWRFWQEIRKDHLSVEFKHSNGLGVILLNEELPGWLSSITAEDSNRTLTITPFARNLFEALGSRAREASRSHVLQGALEKAEGCRAPESATPRPALAMLKDFKARIGAVAGSLRGRAERKAVAREFDREFYLRSNPDVAAARVDPLDHFLKLGWHERRNPTPGFDVQHYTVSNPDVAASGLNPFYHFVAHGRAEGRSPLPSLPNRLGLQGLGQVDPSAAVRVQTDVTNVPVAPPSASEREAMAGAFDREFYLASNPDVAAAGVDPFEHYLAVGAREGRSPTPGFDPTYYQEANPDVTAAGLNPFYHYLVAGRAEGRPGRRPHAAERQLIAEARPMTKRAAEWSAAHVWRRPVEYDALARALRILLPAHRDTVVVALSHDDYTRVPGGIQNCIGDEQAAFNRSGLSYVHLAPAIPLPTLSYADVNDFLLIVTVDGEQVGCATAPDFLSVLADRRHEDRFKLILTIHSLLGSSAALIQAIQERLAPDRSFVWVHDFSTLCSNYALLRNDVEFCWSPPIASNACGICAYGAERQAHWKAIEAIFEALKPIVLAPSEPAREFWVQKAKFPHAEIRVAPHAHPEITGARAPLADTPRPVRVAFVGNSGAHKGWHVFVELAKLRWGDPRYSFFHLSSYPSAPVAGVAHIPVTVSAADRYAMTNALITHEIDVVVNWTLCYETFSFTTYESILAGAMVLVRADAGNATYLVTTEPSGAAVADKEELFRMFEDGTVLDFLREYRSKPIPIGRLVPDSSAVRIALD